MHVCRREITLRSRQTRKLELHILTTVCRRALIMITVEYASRLCSSCLSWTTTKRNYFPSDALRAEDCERQETEERKKGEGTKLRGIYIIFLDFRLVYFFVTHAVNTCFVKPIIMKTWPYSIRNDIILIC